MKNLRIRFSYGEEGIEEWGESVLFENYRSLKSDPLNIHRMINDSLFKLDSHIKNLFAMEYEQAEEKKEIDDFVRKYNKAKAKGLI
jgi:hypothetical protein